MTDSDTEVTQPFKNILLTTDGSEFSTGTERVALEMASQHQAHVDILRLLLADPGTPEAAAEQEETDQLMARITGLCTERGISFTPVVKPASEPSQGIMAAAKELNSDLVVIGRRGRRGLARMMVGDATAKVIEKAECSVLVVPRLVTFWESGVLLAMEPDQASDTAAHAAFHMAKATHLPLTILMVADKDEDDDERTEANQKVNRLVAMGNLREVATEGMVQTGKIDDLILEVARQRSADLIVCEPRDRTVMERIFNTNNLLHLIGQTHAPVMVVK